MNSYFFQHLLECLKKQKIIQKQLPTIRAEWQATIDMTYEQALEMLKENRRAYDKKVIRESLSVHDSMLEHYWEYDTDKSKENIT